MSAADWTIIETTESEFNATQLHHKETVFALGNGYLGTRGSFEEGYLGASPATLIHGIYDEAPLVSPELVNCPDWLPLTILIGAESDAETPHYRFRLDQGTVLSYRRWLDMYRGVLTRRVRWRSPAGQVLDLWFERFVSLADQHVTALRCRITPIDCDVDIEVLAGINGYADNQGIFHWDFLDQGGKGDAVWLHARTRHSKHELGMATRLHVSGVDDVTMAPTGFQGCPTVVARLKGRSQQSITLEKTVTVFTSREASAPAQTARQKLASLPDYTALLAAHETAWADTWQDSDIAIEGDLTAQLAIRYNLFQILSAAPRHDDRVSIPAKTLSGFAYRGHIFWDTEIFILPFLTLSQPALARNLLNYRYHTLEGARRKAKAVDCEGALYVWESADTGDESTPSWVPGPDKNLVRIWCGDIEQHINTDVAYAVYQYWQATQDDAWMQACGAEMILDTAVFWGSRVTWNGECDRYEIRNVIGPDEYHERIDNNTFTNRMVQWHLTIAVKTLEWLRQNAPDQAMKLEQQLGLTGDRLHHWQHVIEKIWVPLNATTGLMEQFEGFFKLEDIDLESYEPRDRSMQVILGIEGANQRQVLKQPDVLMLLYLLRQAVFVDKTQGYDLQTLQTNWNYYNPRTDHTYGSSLGPAVHGILACDLNRIDEAYEHFMRAALVDLADVRGNAAEGIHGASAGGVWQVVVWGFAGIELTEDGPIAHPRLPENWTRLQFKLNWRGQTREFDLRSDHHKEASRPVMIHPTLPIQAVIFDLDGVLTDTSEFHYLSWKRLADEDGLPFDREDNEALRGLSRQESLLRLLKGKSVSDEVFQEMMDRKNGYYLDLIQSITPDHVLPGVLPLLTELRSAGIKMAIGSSSKNAQGVVQRLGIAKFMDVIGDGHCVTNSKPAPDIFLYGANQLGLNPASCLVMEDATSGIEAALTAGMWAIGLGPEERVGAAHLVLPNLDGVHWVDIVAQLTCQRQATATQPTVKSLTESHRR